MARRRPDPDDPCVQIVNDYQQGMRRLFPSAACIWVRPLYLSARGLGLTNRAMADACGIDEVLFGRYVNCTQDITPVGLAGLVIGFSRLAQRHGFDYTPPVLPNDPRSFAIAGHLLALNEEGTRQALPAHRSPLGVLHYYCLRLMFANRTWHEAVAGRYSAPQVTTLCEHIFQQAQRQTQQLPHQLEAYRHADRTYPLAGTHAALRELLRVWTPAWENVADCLGGHLEP